MTIEPYLLDVRNVGKFYARSQKKAHGYVGRDMLRMFFGFSPRLLTPDEEDSWAVKDLNFRVQRGEALGIIGFNGSGKTTTLRMLAGQLRPDCGEIHINGRSSSIIALAAGMEPTATGRNNIYLKGSMIGRSKADMDAVVDQIIEFTELGVAIDRPFYTYSSGMKVRLAFAVAVFSFPDLLIIDETLAVGDFRFKQKCLAHMRKLREKSAFVLVSHSLGDIRRFCDRVLVLNEGRVEFEGPPADAIEYFISLSDPLDDMDAQEKLTARRGKFVHNHDEIKDVVHGWCDENGQWIDSINPGMDLHFRAQFNLSYTPMNATMGVPIWSNDGTMITALSSTHSKTKIKLLKGMNDIMVRIPMPALNPGRYDCNFGLSDGAEHLYRQPSKPLKVLRDKKKYWGKVNLEQNWTNIKNDIG